MVRRTIALLGAVVAVVLLVVGINSCLDSRKDTAFRDYAADVRALVNAEQDLSNRLFETLSRPGRGDALDVQTQVNAMRVDAEELVDRAKGTDHPGDLNTAHGWLVTAFEFRADAITKIANLLPTALGERGRQAAIESIAGQMQALLASDVIYSQRAIPALTSAFSERGIEERFPNERFLPDLGWLDPDTVQSRLEQLSGTEQPATPGNGQMIALLAPSREIVNRCHALAMVHGGSCEGPPGLRPHYHPDYFGAYMRDPDGNKLCVCCHEPG